MVNIIDTGSPRVKQYMSETDRALQVSEIAEYLGVTDSTAFGLLDLMVAFGTVEKVKRRNKNYYYLKDIYSDEQIQAMLPPERVHRKPRPRGRPRKTKPTTSIKETSLQTIIEKRIPQVEQYMSEIDRPINTKELAEYLDVSKSTAYTTLDLMYGFGVVNKFKRGRERYYLLKGVYSDEQIQAMFPPDMDEMATRRYSYKDEYLSALEERASSGEGLPALAFLSLSPEEVAETLTAEPPVEPLPALMGEEKPEPLIKSRPFGTVRLLPKDYRRLTKADTSYLKNLMKGLGGCEGLERYNTIFIKFSALENGRYGEVLYLSTGTNPWDHVRKVTVDPNISDYMVLPNIEMKRWVNWNDFLTGLKETRRYSPGLYDEMLDRFMESGHKLVEITVENRGTAYVRKMLKRKIEERGLTDRVEASRVGEWIYLEKVE